ncbi:biotin--[acetyl-CoA-carboxylase] ligase [Fodinibius sediminis]|uniref:BirA family transcriptional regulator, biotin operon repressor / biotin-[acetyl-CoA-carboxylase] ligase n=1 Tax=Fodinibius sediminis TaxID=1214077 RepID=A0A521D5G6_9BACT|nr:biotin--[acetyl-CoA-carboxylase] ligase [Fodinibius sediminis]SMO66938.1 BirA family transcriptional regulator, biotin operon repressor / biotin-[acetyl-CoA-carboxylase] ligase [Fodinibius sediminis]
MHDVLSDSFDVSVFKKSLSTQWLGREFRYFSSLPSTNTYLKELDAGEITQGTIVVTDEQFSGRGQYDRTWTSEPGQNLTFSMAFKPQSAEGFHVLTLACALALVEQLRQFDQQASLSIKWPNDVLFNHKKVAGLLTEAVFLGNKPDRLIIGMGLNVNQQEYDAELSDKATSIRLEIHKKLVREQLLCDLLYRIEYKYKRWNERQLDLLREVNRKIQGYGKWIGLRIDGKKKNGAYKLLGVNEVGRLVVLNREGGLESFSYEQIRVITD